MASGWLVAAITGLLLGDMVQAGARADEGRSRDKPVMSWGYKGCANARGEKLWKTR